MSEEFLQYIWFQRLYSPLQTTTDGQAVEIIDVGQRNTDAGPDVFNAKIRIGETLWAGNAEFHVRASDWLKHGHNNDAAYNSVILHVVQIADATILRNDGQPIPQLELRYNKDLETNFDQLMQAKQFVRCADKLPNVPSFEITAWLDRLCVERLEQKKHAIESLLQQTTNNWEEAFYITLARNFGFSTNALAFELLAKSLPLKVLGKHRDNLTQIEALLFGQAGLLDKTPIDNYTTLLKREYQLLKAKFTLTPIDGSLWKFLRLRPANFPTIHLAQFANLIYKSHQLFSQIIAETDLQKLRQLFDCEASGYWQSHYTFGEESPQKTKKLAATSIDILLINSIAPFLFCYGKAHNNDELQQRALELLSTLPAEKNHIIAGFAACGIEAHTAADSQALIQLKRAYCDVHNCLRCRLARYYLK